jgi:hypothetical protein
MSVSTEKIKLGDCVYIGKINSNFQFYLRPVFVNNYYENIKQIRKAINVSEAVMPQWLS